MYNRNPKDNGFNLRPAGFSDSDDDTDFCFNEPIQPSNNHCVYQDLKNTVQERFQSIVIQGKFVEFETMFREELNSTADYRFGNGWTPLMYTCFHGQPPMADFLLERGADPNAHADSVTPLMLLCTNAFGTDEQLREIALKLLDKGAIVNLGDKQGVTPLMRAIQCGRKDLLELFVENNANIEMRDRQGWTAIFWAAHCNQTDMMERLISLGARVIEVDRANRTILDIAECHENSVNVKILEPFFNAHNAEEPIFVCQEPDYWLEYYPGLRKNHKQVYKEEIVNLLYGMNCDNLRPLILNSGMDLRTFLLLEEKDMIKLGIEMQFERHRLKQGLRAFHLRNWKLKSVSGLYARQTENYNLCECLETAATNLMQFYILEASLQYTIREFNKIRGQIKKQAEGTSIISQINDSITKLCINIKNIKKEIGQMQQSLIVIRDNNLQPIQVEEEPKPLKSSLQATAIGVLTFGVGYITIRSIRWCISIFFKKFLSVSGAAERAAPPSLRNKPQALHAPQLRLSWCLRFVTAGGAALPPRLRVSKNTLGVGQTSTTCGRG